MKKSLHFSLFVLSFFLFLTSSKAQTDRVQFARTESPTTVGSTQINTLSPEMKIEKELHFSTQKRDSLTSKSTTEKLVKNTPDVKDKKLANVKQPGTARKVKIISETDDNDKKDVKEPLHPDFQVTATKEEPYDVTTASKETASTQLVKVERIPQDDFEVANAKAIITPTHVTLSPLKRKYLEGVAADLEKEIKEGKKLSIETQARKKELDDLRKLLAQ